MKKYEVFGMNEGSTEALLFVEFLQTLKPGGEPLRFEQHGNYVAIWLAHQTTLFELGHGYGLWKIKKALSL